LKRTHSRTACVAFVLFLSATSLAASKKSPPPGPITVLFSFPCNSSGVCADGYFPASLLESPDGNFYGTAFVGGTGTNAQGTVFKFNPVTGQVSVIYSFAELGNGSLPYGVSPEKLVEGTDGFLYGTTLEAGGFGAGTVYKLSKSGMIQAACHERRAWNESDACSRVDYSRALRHRRDFRASA
jgi:uncharacterized repeat protein (TIGR03803 family)